MTATAQTTSDTSIATLELDGVRTHTLMAPDEGYRVTSTVFELPDRVLVLDAMIFRRYARELGDLIDALGKPIDRFLLSHTHPDHFSGFDELTRRFPGVQLAATTAVRDHLERWGPATLRARREHFGDEIGARVVVPDATVVEGELDIAGVRFAFREHHGLEADHGMTVALPDQGVVAVADLVAPAGTHLFVTRNTFDAWIGFLEELRDDVARTGIDHIIVGHGAPVTPAVLPDNIAYLLSAKQAFAESGDAESFQARLSELTSGYGPDFLLEWSASLLYGVVDP